LLFGYKTDLINKTIVVRLSKPKTHKPANHNICSMGVFSINDSLGLNRFLPLKTVAFDRRLKVKPTINPRNDSLYDVNGPGHDCRYHGKSKTASRLAQAVN